MSLNSLIMQKLIINISNIIIRIWNHHIYCDANNLHGSAMLNIGM